MSEGKKRRPCPICGATSYTPFAPETLNAQKINAFSYASRKQPEFMCHELVQCSRCHLVYAISPPDDTYLGDAYEDAAYDSSEEAECAAQSYADALKPHLARLKSRTLAADVGAGNGALLPYLKQCGFREVLGIEPSKSAVAAAPEAVRKHIRQEMFRAESLQGRTAALVCSFMTLEHLRDPGTFVRTAFELLEPQGMLAIVVHNWQGLLNRLLGLRSPIIDIEHMQLFCPEAIQTLFRQTGFTDNHVSTIRNIYPVRYWLRLAPLPPRLKESLLGKDSLKHLLQHRLAVNVGNLLAVGVKP